MSARRLRALSAALGVATIVVRADVAAQTSSGACTITPSVTNGADACRKALDLFAFVMPQAGVALAGGNPILGEGGTMGGWGKRAISLRVTAVDGQLPKNTVPIRVGGTAQADDFGAERAPVPMPSVDAAIGLFTGMPAGLTNIGGIDVLLSATWMPTVEEKTLQVAPSGTSLALGYGVRVGVLQESSLIPGISLSVMRRKLPTTGISYTAQNDTLALRDLSLTADGVRLVISKRFLILGLAGGIGRDRIEAQSSMNAAVNESVLGVNQRYAVSLADMRTKVERNTVFVNASFGVLAARVVGEFGWSSEGDAILAVNQFGGRKANEGYRYGSLGLTVRF